jgi:two-component system cell cycle sensor histidine kinase/response regulator CckA
MVRSLSARVLAEAGFAVAEAGDGAGALDTLATLSAPPDVLVTDLQMPRMDGRELATRLRAKRPDLRVLFVSGNAPDDLPAPDPGAVEAFLQKPFAPDELVRAVRSLADRTPLPK